jgi:hypothetical protein
MNAKATGTADDDNVVEFPRAVGVAKGELHVVIGTAVLEYMRAQGEALINGPKGAWLYSHGIWELRIDINAWLNVRIEGVCEGLGFTNTNKLTSEVRNRILRRPELWRDDIAWDQHGKIPTRSGLIDPLTGELEPARPDHFCTWRVECDYDPPPPQPARGGKRCCPTCSATVIRPNRLRSCVLCRNASARR